MLENAPDCAVTDLKTMITPEYDADFFFAISPIGPPDAQYKLLLSLAPSRLVNPFGALRWWRNAMRKFLQNLTVSIICRPRDGNKLLALYI